MSKGIYDNFSVYITEKLKSLHTCEHYFNTRIMKNWSTHLRWNPSELAYPETEAALVALVQKALATKHNIRLIGSAHSFTPLCVTDSIQISLDKYQGLISIDRERLQATVKAGTKLHLLNELLAKEGLALENLGDINVQSIAGAISTGTHGTGTAFGNLSTQVVRLKLINGQGQLLSCSPTENPELFKAAQVSLGALGILTEITLQCVPSYRLALHIKQETLEEMLSSYQEINQSCRNFEFYWFPNTPYVLSKRIELTQEPADKRSFKDYFQEVLLENYAFKMICDTSYYFPSLTHRLSRFAASTVSPFKKVNESGLVFSTSRIVRFNEMEYNLPIEAYLDAKKELVNWINKHNKTILFPLENRFVKGDDIYLSPAYGRDSAYIAAHVYHKKDFKPYFTALEEIMKAYQGRPHWGKMHTLGQEELQARYPEFDRFRRIRQEQDPEGIFLSPYLQTLFG